MSKSRRYILCLGVAIGAIVIVVFGIGAWALPRCLFRKALIHPIPPSVRAIRADSSFGLNQHQYVLRFRMKAADLAAILGARSFAPVARVRYRHNTGTIEYEDSPSLQHSFALYRPHEGNYSPHWFKFDTSNNFRAYVAEEKDRHEFYHLDLLLYDASIGEAYFIEYEQGGSTAIHIRIAFGVLRACRWRG